MTEQEQVDELAAVLAARESGTPAPGEVAASTVALATLAARLGDAVTVPALTSPSRARVGERVLADVTEDRAASDEGADPATEPSRTTAPRWTSVPLGLAAGLVLVLALGAGLVVAADDTQPGGLLHPVKLAGERVEITLAGGPLDTARAHLDQAEARLQELEAGVPEDPDAAAATLTRWAQSTTSARELLRSGDVPAPVADEVLLAFVEQQRSRLLDIAPELPEQLVPTAVEAVELLDEFEQEATT